MAVEGDDTQDEDELTPIISIEAIPGRPSQPAPPIKAKLGNYEIVQSIGSGGMAEVFLARNVGPMGFEKLVVVKTIHPHLAKEAQFVTMFQDEARLAARIHDPRIVQIYELGEANGTFFMAMEYLAGESVSTIIKSSIKTGVPLPIPLAARIVADVAAGLHAAHELRDSKGQLLDVVHRDVSHGNIVVLYSGAVKVLDFGVAKARDSLNKTSAGERKGKFGYMSPEQVIGEELDRRSDVFSLGVVLWELLTRQRLFSAATELETVRRVIDGVPPKPSTLDPSIPPELDAITLKALAKDRRARFQTAEDMSNALEAWIRQAGVAASMNDVGAYMRATFTDRKHQRERLLSSRTGEEAPLASIHHDTASRVMSGDEARSELERMRKRARVLWLSAGLAAAVALAVAYYWGRGHRSEEPESRAIAMDVGSASTSTSTSTSPGSGSAIAEPSLAGAMLDHAEAAIHSGRIASPPGDNALEILLDAEKADPKNPRIAQLRAQAVKELLASADELWTAGKTDSARSIYSDVLLFDPDNKIASDRGKRPEPRTSKHAAPAASEEVPWLVTQIDLAIIERRLVAPPGHNALEYLQQLRQIDPNNDAAHRLGGEVANALQTEAKAKPNDAKQLLDAARVANGEEAAVATNATSPEKVRDPAKAKDFVGKGNTQLAQGHLPEARNEFERAIAVDSGSHAALAGLAEVAYNESDYTRAVLAAKRALALAPSSVQYRMLLAKSYYKLLRYDDAIKQWQRVLELDPKNTAAQKDIEMAQRRKGG